MRIGRVLRLLRKDECTYNSNTYIYMGMYGLMLSVLGPLEALSMEDGSQGRRPVTIRYYQIGSRLFPLTSPLPLYLLLLQVASDARHLMTGLEEVYQTTGKGKQNTD